MKVLLATDGLPAAEAAEDLLVHVARRDLDVLVVTAAGKGSPEGGAHDVVTTVAGRLKEAGFRPRGRALEGAAHDAIPSCVREESVDLVVLGAGNKSWLGRALFGGISTQLLHSPRSVLIVNESRKQTEGKTPVLLALDGSPDARTAVPGAMDFLDPARCLIRLFSVVAVRVPAVRSAPVTGYAAPGFDEKLEAELTEEPRRAAEAQAEVMRKAGFEVEVRVTLGAPVKRILEEARDMDAALVILGARLRGGLDRALVGSVSDQVARYTPAALILRPDRKDDRSLE